MIGASRCSVGVGPSSVDGVDGIGGGVDVGVGDVGVCRCVC